MQSSVTRVDPHLDIETYDPSADLMVLNLGPGTELAFTVTNLTDELYEDILGFSSPGRAYYFGVDVRF